jgi:hypothetical protein
VGYSKLESHRTHELVEWHSRPLKKLALSDEHRLATMLHGLYVMQLDYSLSGTGRKKINWGILKGQWYCFMSINVFPAKGSIP